MGEGGGRPALEKLRVPNASIDLGHAVCHVTLTRLNFSEGINTRHTQNAGTFSVFGNVVICHNGRSMFVQSGHVQIRGSTICCLEQRCSFWLQSLLAFDTRIGMLW